ncbi:MAG: single-stranded-DNA-specific exonuclease RecJ [Burkholderiaceae bacterium]|nr:single-stranded-DNA-specific exonuclease RecJ [Burkholderiaceae bacterium]
MAQPVIKTRLTQPDATQRLTAQGLHPLLARLYASRGVIQKDTLSSEWKSLLDPKLLTQNQQAAELLADHIEAKKTLLVVADYDCDGATACAVAIRGLRALGAHVDYLVPNRFETGYGLSPAVVDLACQHRSGKPDLIITVDNGIASVDGAAEARLQNIKVLITDHHLPGDALPNAAVIVNPNQPGCNFPSKNLAGVGVMFYVLMALRAELRQRGHFVSKPEPKLDALIDLVALGTVADVVKLDQNNRLLVNRGIDRLRRGFMQPGIRALFAVAGRQPQLAVASDFGFIVGPRINAAGRLADMSVGIECLITDDEDRALVLARELDTFNRERRKIEATMREQALASIGEIDAQPHSAVVCVFDERWHQGVVGIVASRLKEQFYRPALAFAPGDAGEIRGSGRSIPDVHLRDVLDLVSKRQPGLIKKFGGHAMAAGLSLSQEDYAPFVLAFNQAVIDFTGKSRFEAVIETDGTLESGYANAQVAQMLEEQVWGSGFPNPLFVDEFTVDQQRLLNDKHLKLTLTRDRQRFEAIWFGHSETVGNRVRVVYRLATNHWNATVTAQLIIEHAASL